MERIKLDIQRFAGGTIDFPASGALQGRIVWSSSSNGASANSSNVYAELQIHRTDSYTTTGTFTGALNINGDNRGFSWYGSLSNGWVGVLSFTVTVGHSSDGSGSCGISGSVNGPSGTSLSGKTSSGGATVTLDKIDRYATITSASNFNDEENPVLGYSNPAGNNVSSLQVCIASSDGLTIYVPYRDISKTSSNYTFNLTNEERNTLRNATPNSNSLQVRYYLKTIISGQTFKQSSLRTMTIVNANPTFSNFTFEDVNTTTTTLTGDNTKNVNGYSNIKVTISTLNKAIALKGATMSKYRFVNGSQSIDIAYSDSDSVNGTIPNCENGTYQVFAIDSRNNSTLVTKLASQVIDYKPISLDTSSKVERNNGGVGGSATLTYSGTMWNDNFGNVTNEIVSSKYEFKKTNSNIWIDLTTLGITPTDITPTLTNNNFNFSGLVRSDNNDTTFDLQSSYDFRITITDKLSTAILQLTPLASGTPNLSLADDGVGIMCDYDENLGGLLQVGGVVIGRTFSGTDSPSNSIGEDGDVYFQYSTQY